MNIHVSPDVTHLVFGQSDERVQQVDDRLAVEYLLRSLKPLQADIVLLRGAEEMRWCEIAEVVSLKYGVSYSPGAVKYRYERAIRAMRDKRVAIGM